MIYAFITIVSAKVNLFLDELMEEIDDLTDVFNNGNTDDDISDLVARKEISLQKLD